ALASQYQITKDGTLILQPDAGGKSQDVATADEQSLTTALIKLSRSTQPVVYFVVGHGERRIDDSGDRGMSSVQKSLESDGFKVQALNLLITDTIPADASVVVIPGPVQ